MERQQSFLFRALIHEWELRLINLFTGVFLLQFVLWFQSEEYGWLPRTVQLVIYMLLFTFLLELIPRINPIYRGLFKFVLLTAFIIIAVGYRPIGGEIKSWSDFFLVYYENVQQFHPYGWFLLGSWFCYAVAMWFFRVRWQMLFVVSISIIALAIRDSFSLLILWDNVAMMIFCGLGLLVVQHYAAVKRKNPSAWAYLSNYPATMAMPVVIVLTLTMLLGSLAPNVHNLLTDPYTLYMNWKGQPMVSSGKFIPSTSILGNGNNASGYGRNDQLLGGGFDYDYTPVMTVDATHRSYWRGETLSFYNGKGWEASEADKQDSLTSVTTDVGLPPDARVNKSLLKTIEVKQTVTFLREETFPILFGAFSIFSVESMNGKKNGFEKLQWSAKQAELIWSETSKSKLDYPKSYIVVSQIPVIDEEAIRTAEPKPIDRAAMAEYLQLPNQLPARVKQLAVDLTLAETNPYDKVKKLESYLKATFPYTNKPEIGNPRNKDFVDRFLFDIKQGYCDYYSTSLAVMARVIGLPSRWVKGYATGTLSFEGLPDSSSGGPPIDILKGLNANGSGVYTVKNSDAHSWVEVYFPDFGWLPFEPTAGFTLPVVTPESEIIPEVPADSTTTLTPKTAGANQLFTLRNGVIVGVFVIILLFLWRYRDKLQLIKLKALLIRKKDLSYDLSQQIVVEFNKFLRFSNKKGYRSAEHETAREMVKRWSSKDAWLLKDLEALLALFEKARYSSSPVTAEEYNKAAGIVKKLRDNM